jgi:hypothetical protein
MKPRGLALAGLLACLTPALLRAQDTSVVARDTMVRDTTARATASDTLYARAPTSPMGALWRSLLVPGWGQAKLNRKLTGAIFIAWEGVTLGMSIKTSHELSYLRATRSSRIQAKEKERQDWLVLLGFNHLFSAVEAYVSSHLWDFPGDLEIQAAPIPGGGFGASFSLPVRLR